VRAFHRQLELAHHFLDRLQIHLRKQKQLDVVEPQTGLVEHLPDDRRPALCIHFCRILLREPHLGPHALVDHLTRDRQMRSTCVDSHVIVKTTVGIEFSGEKNRAIVFCL